MNQPGQVQNLSPAALQARLQAGSIVLVDVREPAEFAQEHIQGAVLHPLSAFDPAKLPSGDIVFQCGTGKRSLTAIQRSAAAFLPHDAHLEGGLAAWKHAGLATIKG